MVKKTILWTHTNRADVMIVNDACDAIWQNHIPIWNVNTILINIPKIRKCNVHSVYSTLNLSVLCPQPIRLKLETQSSCKTNNRTKLKLTWKVKELKSIKMRGHYKISNIFVIDKY